MATTYQSQLVQSGQAFVGKGGGYVFVREATYTSPVFVVDDIVQMLPVLAGEKLVGLQIWSTDVDTGGSPAIIYDVGDDLDPDRYIDGSTIGQTGGFAEYGAGVAAASVANLDHAYTADNTVDIKVAVAPATGAAGTLRARGFYTTISS